MNRVLKSPSTKKIMGEMLLCICNTIILISMHEKIFPGTTEEKGSAGSSR